VGAKDKVGLAVVGARPYVERIAQDPELHEHVKSAFGSAQKIYAELAAGGPRVDTARRLASDADLQNELRKAVGELRRAGARARGEEQSHTTRNATLLVVGIVLGILFNPATGPETRRWLKDKLFGAEEPFEYSTNGEAA
jgi:hypothetical protein